MLEVRPEPIALARLADELAGTFQPIAGHKQLALDLWIEPTAPETIDSDPNPTRRLRADPRFARLPIIALTAKAMADDRDRCLAAGANDYIAKPLDVDKLLSLVRVWIGA